MDIFCRNCLRERKEHHFLKFEEVFYRMGCGHLVCGRHYTHRLYEHPKTGKAGCGCLPKDKTMLKDVKTVQITTDDFSDICDKGHFLKEFVSKLRENRRIEKDVINAVSLWMFPRSTLFRTIIYCSLCTCFMIQLNYIKHLAVEFIKVANDYNRFLRAGHAGRTTVPPSQQKDHLVKLVLKQMISLATACSHLQWRLPRSYRMALRYRLPHMYLFLTAKRHLDF